MTEEEYRKLVRLRSDHWFEKSRVRILGVSWKSRAKHTLIVGSAALVIGVVKTYVLPHLTPEVAKLLNTVLHFVQTLINTF